MERAMEDLEFVDLASKLRAVVSPLERKLRQHTTELFTPTQLSVLGAINRHGPISVGDLAARERLSAPTVSKAVASLEAREIIERIPDPDDRRICRVAVSEAGGRWIEGGRAQRNAWLAERIATLSPSDRSTLATAVPVLEQILAEQA